MNESNSQYARQIQSGAARAAMLGISDGLVTNTALILGLAGAGASSGVIRIAGIASLVAGAFSMAVGEYLSMQAQRELLQTILKMERAAIKDNPDQAKQVLADILTEHGVAPEHAAVASQDLVADPAKATEVYARDRLGINPDELGSAYGAAASSLATFAVGALVPLVPYFWLTGSAALSTGLGLAAVAALAVGAYLARMTAATWYKVALRQLLLMALAAGVTYAVGLLFHTSIS